MKLSERIKEKLMGYITPRGFDELIGAELKEVDQLEAENKMLKAEVEAAGSLLLDVQQDCVDLREELGQLRVEGARADDC